MHFDVTAAIKYLGVYTNNLLAVSKYDLTFQHIIFYVIVLNNLIPAAQHMCFVIPVFIKLLNIKLLII